MKPSRSLLTAGIAAAILTHTAPALTLPVSEDTSTSTVPALAKVAGRDASLTVSASRQGLIRFEAGVFADSLADAGTARLIIYLNKVTAPGVLTVHRITEEWSEGGASAPAFDPAPIATIPAASVVAKQYVIIDVTATVQAWLNEPGKDFGFAIAGSGGAQVLIGAKEDPGTDYPAELQIESGTSTFTLADDEEEAGSGHTRASATSPIGAFVTNADIKSNTIKGKKLAANSVDGSKLNFNSVTGAQLATETITSANIANGTITNADLSAGFTFPAGTVADGSITTAKLANGAVTPAKLDLSGGSVVIGNAGSAQSLALTTNSVTANPAPGNSLNSSTLSLRAPKGSVSIECSDDQVFDPAILMPQGALRVGTYTRTDDSFLTVRTAGGNFYTSGIKLRHFDDDFGVTLQSNEVTNHFQILSHFQNPAGISCLEISRNSQATASVANFLTVGEVHNDGTGNRARLVVSGTGFTTNIGAFAFFNPSTGGAIVQNPNDANSNRGDLSIYASNAVAAGNIFSFSDSRIKNPLGRSDASTDLGLLRKIEITDYTHKDTVTRGSGAQKKVIAQQVEKVFPQAVSRQTDVVPDIFQKATAQDGWVQLATDLKAGERVRILGDETDGIYAVLEVLDGAFRTDALPAGSQLFVYGREVKDFRVVDYDAIAMLNVSATQELAKKLEARDATIAALKAEVAALKAADRAREARLTRLESAIDQGTARTVRASFVK